MIWDRVECAAVISAMEIVMRNNRIRGSGLKTSFLNGTYIKSDAPEFIDR